MGNTQVIKRTFTGVELKGLMSNPSANTEETIPMFAGLLGAGEFDTVFITRMWFKTSTYLSNSLTVFLAPATNPSGGQDAQSSNLHGNPSFFMSEAGNVDGLWKVYDDGDMLSDIPDGYSIDIYVECAIPTDITP